MLRANKKAIFFSVRYYSQILLKTETGLEIFKTLEIIKFHPSTVKEIEAHSVYVICPKYIKQQNQDNPMALIFPLNHD